MLNKLLLSSALSAALISPLANAIKVEKIERFRGKIVSVDKDSKIASIKNSYTGEIKDITFTGTNKDSIHSQQYSFDDLEIGHEARIKTVKYKNESNNIQGEVVNVNHADMTATIKVKGKLKTVKVHFSKDVVVNGVNNISKFEDLKKGHLVTIR